MELTLELLLYFIADLEPECLRGPSAGSVFAGVQQFFGGIQYAEQTGTQYLYVSGLQELLQCREDLEEGMTVLAVRDMEAGREELDSLPCSLILVCSGVPLPSLLNRMIDVFSRMANYDKAMHIAALEGKSVQTLLDLCEAPLAHPTIIFDSGFDVLAYTKNIPCEYGTFRETIENGYTDSDTMQKIRKNKIFDQLKSGKPLIAPSVGESGRTNIYLSFSSEQSMLGYACVYFGEDNPDQGYLDMLRIFTENISFCLKRDYESSHYGQMMYETFLLNLMNPSGFSEEQMEEQIKNIGDMPLQGRFVLGVLDFPEEENAPLRFTSRLLAREMWNVKPFLYEGRICLLKTLDKGGEADQAIERWELDNIDRLLGDCRFALGISNIFSDITDLRYAFLQAKAALAFREPEERCTLYGDIYYDYLFSLLEQEMPVYTLQPEFYSRMKEYDREHGTEYIRIIEAYLECGCNATHAAEKLFIHRNTVRNAVLFVQERWNIRVEDPDIQKKFMISNLADRYLDEQS